MKRKSFTQTLGAASLLCMTMVGAAPAIFTVETVPVGDVGNAADSTGYGAVNYNYSIGKYDVTVSQYTELLNVTRKRPGRTKYSDLMYPQISRTDTGSVDDPYLYSVVPGHANEPVAGVSYWNACSFANWLGNGQGDADIETGAYTLNGYDGSAGGEINRNPGARWVIPTVNEWYKAAYYAGGTDGGYFSQPTPSAYGVQGLYGIGTGLEWSETVSYVGSVAGRNLVGIDFKGTSLGDPSKSGGPVPPGIPEPIDHGGFEFRVALVPEPASLALLALAALALLCCGRR